MGRQQRQVVVTLALVSLVVGVCDSELEESKFTTGGLNSEKPKT